MKILSVTAIPLLDDVQSWRIWNIARLLRLRGHTIYIAQYVTRRAYRKAQGKTIDVHDSQTFPFVVSRRIGHIPYLVKLFGNYDVLYGNTHLGALYAMPARFRRTPAVFDMHGGLVEELQLINQNNVSQPHLTRVSTLLSSRLIDFIDLHFSSKIVCVSKKMMRYLYEEKKIPMHKMAYVTNGVDLNFFQPISKDRRLLLRKELGLEGKFIIGYIGGSQKWQGVESLLAAANMINDPSVSFIVVGAGIRYTNKNTLSIPRIPREVTPEYYSICDVLVLPRPSHPATEIAAPTKFAEYAAMGKPILTTCVGDAANFVKRYDNGVVVSNNSVAELVLGIEKLRSKTTEELEFMGERSRKLAENEFDWNKVIDNLLAVLQSLVQ